MAICTISHFANEDEDDDDDNDDAAAAADDADDDDDDDDDNDNVPIIYWFDRGFPSLPCFYQASYGVFQCPTEYGLAQEKG